MKNNLTHRELGATWDVAEVPVDAEVRIGGDDAALEDLLAHHRGKGVLGSVDVGLDQPRVLWPWKMVNTLLSKHCLLYVSSCTPQQQSGLLHKATRDNSLFSFFYFLIVIQ